MKARKDLKTCYNVSVDSLQRDPLSLLQILNDDQWTFPFGGSATDTAIQLLEIQTLLMKLCKCKNMLKTE